LGPAERRKAVIKKRKGWYRHIKPRSPVCPRKPEKVLKLERLTVLYKHPGWSMKLSDVPVPEGRSLSDLRLHVEDNGDGDITLEFCLCEEYVGDNPLYPHDMKLYEKARTLYEARRKEFKAELAEWKVWNAEQDAAEVKARIDAAERLLRQHGHLPGGPDVG